LWGGISNNDTKEESALDILKKRYAKGEISKEDFKEMKKTLEG
jgi:putative membrane protein